MGTHFQNRIADGAEGWGASGLTRINKILWKPVQNFHVEHTFMPLPDSFIPRCPGHHLLDVPYDLPVYLVTLCKTPPLPLISPIPVLIKDSVLNTPWVSPLLLCLNLVFSFDHSFPLGLSIKGRQTFSGKGQTVNRLGFGGHRASISMTQYCHCSRKAAINTT